MIKISGIRKRMSVVKLMIIRGKAVPDGLPFFVNSMGSLLSLTNGIMVFDDLRPTKQSLFNGLGTTISENTIAG